MALRTFIDADGLEWDAYDVVPRQQERRHYDRRSGQADVEHRQERRDVDRRVTVGGAELISSTAGWLCFERQGQRRRLSPIPADWLRCDEPTLARYCQAARPVRTAERFGSAK